MLTFGLFFYWSSWIIWTGITFFMNKSRQRTLFSCTTLILIILANKYILIGNYQISISYMILLAGSLIMFTRLSKQLYHLFISFTIMIGYSAILLWKSSTPLWLFIHELLFIPFVCGLLIIILSSGIFYRIITGIFGIAAGELLCSLIFSSYDLNLIIGDLSFFDQLFVTILFVIIIHISQQAVSKSYSLLDAYQRRLNVQRVNNYKKLS